MNKLIIASFITGILKLLNPASDEIAQADNTALQRSARVRTYRIVLDPKEETKLFAEVRVPVKKITKKLGEPFNKGEILIQLEDKVLQSNLLKAEADLIKTQAQAKAMRKLYRDNIASEFELKTAEADYIRAIADRDFAKKQYESTQIIAPYDGKVKSLHIQDYELPNENEELIEIIDDSVLVAKLLVTSDLLPKLKIGQSIKIRIKETGDLITAKISRIGAVIDASSSTIKIEAEIDNRDGKLKAGMIGTVKFGGVS